MKQIFTLIAMLVFAQQLLLAQVYCRNSTPKDVWVAVAYNYVPSNSPDMQVIQHDNWISEGWFYIPPQGTVQLSSHIGYHASNGIKTNYFYYATHRNGRDYAGGRFYLIDNTAEFSPDKLSFRIEEANSKDNYPQMSNLQMRPFRPATIQNEGQYTIIIQGDELNDEPIIHDIQHEESYFK
jgi:hypothetical protein